MKKYEALVACTFQSRYWHKGQVGSFDDAIIVPRHFRLIEDQSVKNAKKNEEALALSQVKTKLEIPNEGFSFSKDKPKSKKK